MHGQMKGYGGKTQDVGPELQQLLHIIIGGPHLPFKMLNGNRTDISGDTKEYSLKMGVGAWILDSVIPHKSPDGPKAGGL